MQPALAGPAEGAASPRRRGNGVRWGMVGALFVVVATLAVVALWDRSPAAPDGPGLVFTIPYGSYQRVAAGQQSAIEIPTRITFKRGETPAITIINEDGVTHRAGPFLVGPNQTFTQRFPQRGEYPIACTVDPAESVVVTVE